MIAVVTAALLFGVILGAALLYDRLGGSAENLTPVAGSTTADESGGGTSGTERRMYDFTVYTLSGEAVSLSDFVGKPVVLNFWASWCSPCKGEMPEFEDAYRRYGKDIHFLMVNMTDGRSETVESASDFVRSEGYTFPVYYDTDTDAAMQYAVSSIPMTFFIGDDGIVVAYAVGAIDGDTIQRGIDMIFEE
ncbi:MAG: TlpA family protein disulfide reductase [Clostridia bacterium]|nr:TlpA family protein disulfide reductase [Clostridia bacterium]